MNTNLVRERVSGRVLSIERKKKDRNILFIGSHKFGTMLVRAVLSDDEVQGIQMNDEIQLFGQLRLIKRIVVDGRIVREVLVLKPVVEHIIRSSKVI